jgi:hypothetical protein
MFIFQNCKPQRIKKSDLVKHDDPLEQEIKDQLLNAFHSVVVRRNKDGQVIAVEESMNKKMSAKKTTDPILVFENGQDDGKFENIAGCKTMTIETKGGGKVKIDTRKKKDGNIVVGTGVGCINVEKGAIVTMKF